MHKLCLYCHIIKITSNEIIIYIIKNLGCYDSWKTIKERYQLKWSTDSSFQVFQNITHKSSKELQFLVKIVKDACSQIPTSYSNHLIYYTLMGLKAEGSCQSISLIKSDYSNYINSKNKTLPSYFSKIMLCIKYKFRISNTISYYSIFL